MKSLGYEQDPTSGREILIKTPGNVDMVIKVDEEGVLYTNGNAKPASALSWVATDLLTDGAFLNAWAGVAAEQGAEGAVTKILVPGNDDRKIVNARVSIAVAPGVGESVTFTVRKNGVDTALIVVIADAALVGSNVVDSVSVSPGDTLTVKMNKTAGAVLAPGASFVSIELM
jgi:hypothetical protein